MRANHAGSIRRTLSLVVILSAATAAPSARAINWARALEAAAEAEHAAQLAKVGQLAKVARSAELTRIAGEAARMARSGELALAADRFEELAARLHDLQTEEGVRAALAMRERARQLRLENTRAQLEKELSRFRQSSTGQPGPRAEAPGPPLQEVVDPVRAPDEPMKAFAGAPGPSSPFQEVLGKLPKARQEFFRAIEDSSLRISGVREVPPDVQQFVDRFAEGYWKPHKFLEKTRRTHRELLEQWEAAPIARRVFVAGSKADRPLVSALAAELDRQGYVVFFYEFCLERHGRLCSSEAVGAFFSTAGNALVAETPEAAASRYVSPETDAARSLRDGRTFVALDPQQRSDQGPSGLSIELKAKDTPEKGADSSPLKWREQQTQQRRNRAQASPFLRQQA